MTIYIMSDIFYFKFVSLEPMYVALYTKPSVSQDRTALYWFYLSHQKLFSRPRAENPLRTNTNKI